MDEVKAVAGVVTHETMGGMRWTLVNLFRRLSGSVAVVDMTFRTRSSDRIVKKWIR
jgi:hypothetical protein